MESGYALPDNYNEVLNINEDGVIGYIEIPKIDVYMPIYHGASEEVLQKGAGHLEASGLPIGGEGNHSIISAHRGLPSAQLLTRLDEMEIGDVFYIHVLNETLAYQVDQINVILPEELALLGPEENQDLITLLTCTPYAVNTHRLLVRGSRIPYQEKNENENSFRVVDTGWEKEYIFAIIIGIGCVATCLLKLYKRKSRSRGES